MRSAYIRPYNMHVGESAQVRKLILPDEPAPESSNSIRDLIKNAAGTVMSAKNVPGLFMSVLSGASGPTKEGLRIDDAEVAAMEKNDPAATQAVHQKIFAAITDGLSRANTSVKSLADNLKPWIVSSANTGASVSQSVFGDAVKVVGTVLAVAVRDLGPAALRLLSVVFEMLMKMLVDLLIELVVKSLRALITAANFTSIAQAFGKTVRNPGYLAVARGEKTSYEDAFGRYENRTGRPRADMLHAAYNFPTLQRTLGNTKLSQLMVDAVIQQGMRTALKLPPMTTGVSMRRLALAVGADQDLLAQIRGGRALRHVPNIDREIEHRSEIADAISSAMDRRRAAMRPTSDESSDARDPLDTPESSDDESESSELPEPPSDESESSELPEPPSDESESELSDEDEPPAPARKPPPKMPRTWDNSAPLVVRLDTTPPLPNSVLPPALQVKKLPADPVRAVLAGSDSMDKIQQAVNELRDATGPEKVAPSIATIQSLAADTIQRRAKQAADAPQSLGDIARGIATTPGASEVQIESMTAAAVTPILDRALQPSDTHGKVTDPGTLAAVARTVQMIAKEAGKNAAGIAAFLAKTGFGVASEGVKAGFGVLGSKEGKEALHAVTGAVATGVSDVSVKTVAGIGDSAATATGRGFTSLLGHIDGKKSAAHLLMRDVSMSPEASVVAAFNDPRFTAFLSSDAPQYTCGALVVSNPTPAQRAGLAQAQRQYHSDPQLKLVLHTSNLFSGLLGHAHKGGRVVETWLASVRVPSSIGPFARDVALEMARITWNWADRDQRLAAVAAGMATMYTNVTRTFTDERALLHRAAEASLSALARMSCPPPNVGDPAPTHNHAAAAIAADLLADSTMPADAWLADTRGWVSLHGISFVEHVVQTLLRECGPDVAEAVFAALVVEMLNPKHNACTPHAILHALSHPELTSPCEVARHARKMTGVPVRYLEPDGKRPFERLFATRVNGRDIYLDGTFVDGKPF